MIIRFKRADEAHLKTLFPYVPKAEYELIMGMDIPVAESVMQKAKVDGFYKYFNVNIPIALIEENPTADDEVDFGPDYVKFLNSMADKFIHSQAVVDSLYPALMLKNNVLLYGRGGHGKSEMTEHFFQDALEMGLIDEEPFIQAFGEGLTEEALFGGIEMKNYLTTGEYLYLVENSFMNHKIVIFEELFDAPPAILLSLKDIMTSGYFRKGNQRFKIKTEMIIGLTNKSKEDFSEDESLEAFAQRFQITTKVEWEEYTKRDFMSLFRKRLGRDNTYFQEHVSKFEELSAILELNNMVGTSFCSPRTAVNSAKLYAFGSSLKLVSDIDQDIVEKYFKENKDAALIEKSRKVLNASDKYFASIIDSCKSIESDDNGDEILDMLSGGSTNFGLEKVLSESDNKVVKVSINRLSWLQTHINSVQLQVSVDPEKVILLKTIGEFKEKLNKIKQ